MPRVEYSILIPTREDKELGNGQPHPATKWASFQEELRLLAHGWRVYPNPSTGEWVDPETGRVVSDDCRDYRVAVEEKDIPALMSLLKEARKLFKQKCLYVRRSGEVEFI